MYNPSAGSLRSFKVYLQLSIVVDTHIGKNR